jgi:hypothetical protein
MYGLDPKDVQIVEGIPVTTAVRAIRDVHTAHLGPALVRAIEDGQRRLVGKVCTRLRPRRFLGEARPSSMLLVVPDLVRPEFLLEIEVIAAQA